MISLDMFLGVYLPAEHGITLTNLLHKVFAHQEWLKIWSVCFSEKNEENQRGIRKKNIGG